MMPKYIRKSSQHKWREVNIASAVKSVLDRRLTLVPKATLFRQCRKESNADEVSVKRENFGTALSLYGKQNVQYSDERLDGLTSSLLEMTYNIRSLLLKKGQVKAGFCLF
ncbi:hypothetical protein PR048_013652 [Dryococelus australis]|uniref:Uncharacterized protein n=1 Tax=Dryococelus australis TaxID=614101 RepID=A0ABQ9HT73_9NEOP|nr:hypothetical protein PR048_013652 [Dryococelus australis]